ncbi:MAG: glycosidase [Candidatus Bathyarchaeota archaeon]|nr:glycosidase [Candidatus Bathyarchaeota archaeon]MDH5779179.1 glycosidase [Candidatus Bathyarchaeota archaeon]
MKRFQGNPILRPTSEHAWETRAVFNTATLYADGRVHILYRAVGNDGISRLGYASSSDGYHIEERVSSPVFEPANLTEKDGCEDPRLTLQSEQIIMAYTALRDRVSNGHQIALTSIALDDFINKRWNWGERWTPFAGVRNKDAAILPCKVSGRYVMFHRIDPDICITYSDDLQRWSDIKAIIGPRMGKWDCLKVGAAGPPIEINEGWLFIYHGSNFENVYRLGVLLLDKGDPEKVLYRSERPILEPTTDYERFGRVPNVVFSCGAILMDDQLLIYYGGADTVVCVATCNLSELIL